MKHFFCNVPIPYVYHLSECMADTFCTCMLLQMPLIGCDSYTILAPPPKFYANTTTILVMVHSPASTGILAWI